MFFRRTTALGAILLFGALGDIVYVNFAYDGGVHVYSSYFVLLAGFLLVDTVPKVYDLLIHEGLSVGGSAGINVAAAIRVARKLGPGHTVATILCDGGARYQSKLFNPEFLRSKNLPVPAWLA